MTQNLTESTSKCVKSAPHLLEWEIQPAAQISSIADFKSAMNYKIKEVAIS